MIGQTIGSEEIEGEIVTNNTIATMMSKAINNMGQTPLNAIADTFGSLAEAILWFNYPPHWAGLFLFLLGLFVIWKGLTGLWKAGA